MQVTQQSNGSSWPAVQVTPLRLLPRFSQAIGAPVYIKHDDVGPISWAGTKARQAIRILEKAKRDGIETLVMCGPPHSNSCRIVAALAASYEIEITVLLHGEPPPIATPNQLILKSTGARLHWAGDISWPELERQAHKLAKAIESKGTKTRIVDPGCSSVDGILAIVDAAGELKSQLDELEDSPVRIIHASASGGLAAGLTIGHQVHGTPPAQSVMIVPDIYPDIKDQYLQMIRECCAVLDIAPPESALNIDWSQIGEGYAINTAAADEAGSLLARTEGLLVDPVYTAKALAAVVVHGQQSDEPIVFWHSGGLPSFFRTD